MCGLTGVSWSERGKPIPRELLERMTGVLRHRGPDDQGIYYSPEDPRCTGRGGAALGHRRLSIIDLGGGHQPVSNEDDTLWIIFNGEIYNYRELRPDLIARGHRFKTESDTEVILHLYEEYGTECLQFMRGMFVFAIWDSQRKRLFFARDRMGQKPLFYRVEAERILFGSELKSLLAVPDLPRTLNPVAVDDYLTYQYVPYPECILHGFQKLPPAHWGIYEHGKLRLKSYWVPPYAMEPEQDPHPRTAQQWQEELRATLAEAVKLRMRSDVPLGAFLSGGVDSTIISGLMQQLSQQPIHTFSIGFPEAKFDERSFAQEAARHLCTDHHEKVVDPSALEMLPRLIWHYDEPFADSSAIPTMALSEMTREHVKVALSGDGGDELFAGYDRYRAVRLSSHLDRLPRFVKRGLAAQFWQNLPASVEQKSFRRRVKRFLSALADPPERRYLKWIAIFDSERRISLYSSGFRERLGGHDSAQFLLDFYAACPQRDMITRTTFVDVMTYLPGDILTKVDIASMSVGLECRSPFMDHHVVELAARMPIEYKIRGNQGKRILTETFRELLPESIRKRPKMGFGVPLDSWFRNELRELLCETLLSRRALERGYFEEHNVRKLVEEHLKGEWDHSYRLWALLVLELWQQVFLDATEIPLCRPAAL